MDGWWLLSVLNSIPQRLFPYPIRVKHKLRGKRLWYVLKKANSMNVNVIILMAFIKHTVNNNLDSTVL